MFAGAEAGREEDGGGAGPTVPGPDREDPHGEGGRPDGFTASLPEG